MQYVTKNMGPVLSVPDPAAPWNEKLIANPYLDKASPIGSFEEYCRGHFHNTYLKEIRNRIAAHTLPVAKFSKIVPEPDDIYVREISVMSMQFGMDQFILSPDNKVHEDALPGYPFSVLMRASVKAVIHVSESVENQQISDAITQWYHVSGYVTFYGNDKNEFHPVENITVYDKDIAPLPNPLDEYLVPIIGNNDLDRISYQVLSEIVPEALLHPSRVNAKKVAQRLKLTIRYARLTDDYSRYGQIVMHDCWLELNGEMTFVPARTILIDREACRRRRGGRTSGSIFHEIDHYILNRPFYEGQRLYNKELCCLCCEVAKEPEQKNSVYWMEWQAEHLFPHMMIPEYVARDYIEHERLSLKRRFPKASDEEIFQKLIPIVADTFYASKECTRIRMKEFGYADTVVGIRERNMGEERTTTPVSKPGVPAADHVPYSCGKSSQRDSQNSFQRNSQSTHTDPAAALIPLYHIDPFPLRVAEPQAPYGTDSVTSHGTSASHGAPASYGASAADPLGKRAAPYGITYTVSPADAANALKNSAEFRKLLECGEYLYADSRFCLCNRSYIFYDRLGTPHLTEYALQNENECCIPFRSRKKFDDYSPGTFNRDVITGTEIVYAPDKARSIKKQQKTIGQAFPEMQVVLENLPGSVGGTLKEHMKRLEVSVEDLEYLSHVSQTTIKSIRNNDCARLELEYFVAICLGLKLEPPYSLDLIRKTRYQFDSSKVSNMYLLLLTSMYWAGIDVANEELIANNLPPLTRKARNGSY